MKNISEDFARFIVKAMLWCFAICAMILAIVMVGPRVQSVDIEQNSSRDIRLDMKKCE